MAVASVAASSGTLKVRGAYPLLYRTVAVALPGSAALIVAVGFSNWGPKGTLAAMVLLLGTPIAAGFSAWLRRIDADDQTLLRA